MKTTYLGPWLDISQEEYENLLNSLQPISGTCIFLDICGSTEIKSKRQYKEWITIIRSSISDLQRFPFLGQPLKIIGDELMYFIPDEESDMPSNHYFIILDSVKNALSSWDTIIDSYLLTLKGAVHYCEEIYPISMIGEKKYDENDELEIIPTKDFYGLDIDLTARLMTEAESRKLIVSDSFKAKVNGAETSVLNDIEGPFVKQFEGVEEEITYHYFNL